MTEFAPHRATPEQWAHVENLADCCIYDRVILELRDRIAALEAAAKDQPVPPPAATIGPEWQPCVKLPITVHVREQRPGETHVSTREGITSVQPDDLIMRGVQGEEYPIGRKLFNQTYRLGEAKGPQAPAPVGGLVEQVGDAIVDGAAAYGTADEPARAAILAVAEWLQERAYVIANGSQWAERLREEVERG